MTNWAALFLGVFLTFVFIWIQWPRIQLWRLARLAQKTYVTRASGRLVGLEYAQGTRSSKGRGKASDLTVAAARVAQAFADSKTGERLHIAGVAFLVTGDRKRALSAIGRATQMHGSTAAEWNDLAVVRLAMFESETNHQQLINALGSVEAALCRDASLAEARFNRALILERMGLQVPAARAYDEYLRIDNSSEWANEARLHRRLLTSPTRADDWKRAIDQIRRAAAANNQLELRRIVTMFPQDARATAEAIFLEEWALATEAHNSNAAAAALKLAHGIGEALVASTGESLLLKSVVAIEKEHDRAARVALATAVRQYVEARRIYEKREVTRAAPLFDAATKGFADFGHPMAALAQFYAACAMFDLGSDDEALTILIHLSRDVPLSHQALHAFIQWEIGVIHGRAGNFHDALDAQLRSISIFAALGEDGNANVVRSQAAGTEASLGHRAEAWRIRLDIFRVMSRSGDPGDLQRALDQAARTEARDGQWENAFALMSVAVDPTLQVNPRIRVSTLDWRALAGHRLGLDSVAAADLDAARRASMSIRDRKIRMRAEKEITFCEAVISRMSYPRRAIALLNEYLDEREATTSSTLKAEALLERGRAWASIGDDIRASRDLRSSLSITQAQGYALPSEQLRDAYFKTEESDTRELADLLVRQHRAGDALNVLEAQRSRIYVVGTHLGWPVGRPVLEYLILPDHVLIFVSNGIDVTVKRVTVAEATLAEAVEALRSEVENEGEPAAIQTLSTFLIEPVAAVIRGSRAVVVVPDGLTARIPFAALLVDGDRAVVDYTTVTIAPSAAVAADPDRHLGPPASILVVGNPAFDRQRFPHLETLPAAAKEAAGIARLYPRGIVLVGSEATKDRFLRTLGTTEIVHLATHAETISSDPTGSCLILAPAGEDAGLLSLSQIEHASLRNTRLVVAAGCATATPAEERRNVDTLALGFLAAGASSVIGSLWNVDDAATNTFMRCLHREMRRGRSPAEALRLTQKTMRSNPGFRRLEAWAGFQVYGSGN